MGVSWGVGGGGTGRAIPESVCGARGSLLRGPTRGGASSGRGAPNL